MNTSFFIRENIFTPSDTRHYLILFLLWPFLAFISALTTFNNKTSQRIVYMFLIYYGLTYVVGELGGAGPDAERYALNLKANGLLPFSDFFKIVVGLYATDTSIDIVEPFISFIVSRFTDDYRILFGVFSALFGFFYLKSIKLLYDRYKENPGWNSLIHMLFFAAILPITAINGFRMWTAAWVFFYGAFHVVMYREPRFLIIALLSSFVHWSFITANAILFIYFFAGNRNFIYIPVALISFILPTFMTQYFNLLAFRLGGSLQGRYEMYSDEAYVGAVRDMSAQQDWFLKIGYDLVFYYLLLAVIIARIKSRKFEKDQSEDNLFSFLLLLLSFVNFGFEIPSFGNRFQIVFFIFATLYVFLYFNKLPGRKINFLTISGLFPMLLYTAIVFRQGAESINAWIFSPGLGIPLLFPGLSLSSLLF